MKYHYFLLLVFGTLACNRDRTQPSSEEGEALNELHAAQLAELEEQHRAEREALNKAHEQDLEARSQVEEVRNIEQRQRALRAQELPATDVLAPVVDDIALARCTRAQRCGSLGPENVEVLLSDCISRLSTKFRDELRSTQCEKGVVPAQVEECLKTIRQETCAAEVEKLASVSECRASSLCAN